MGIHRKTKTTVSMQISHAWLEKTPLISKLVAILYKKTYGIKFKKKMLYHNAHF
jgi:hypothetical protein